MYTYLLMLNIFLMFDVAHADVSNHLDRFIRQRITAEKLPGLAVAVSKNGKTILERTYGFRSIQSKETLSGQTLFPIGSLTKSFTAAAIAKLVEQKKLQFDDKIVDILPAFKLSDSAFTMKATVKDALTHMLGLPEDGALWYGTGLSSEELFKQLQNLTLSSQPEKKWGYSNFGYLILGKVIEKISGRSWVDYLSHEILDPLQMNKVVLSFEKYRSVNNRVLPHSQFDRSVMKEIGVDEMAAAGGIYASLQDMIIWGKFQIGEKRGPISLEKLKFLQSAKVALPPVPELPGPEFQLPSYGMGWFIDHYRGDKVVWHTGGHGGYTSRLAAIPKHNLIIVILTNLENAHKETRFITLRAIDLVLGKPPIDWANRD
jgi:CubicO group peptidase (beta-lactamase class C family)